MLIPNQKIETTWTNTNKKHYIELGYEFTNMHDKLYVSAEDLPRTSKARVDVACDGEDCNIAYDVPYMNYAKSMRKYGKYLCRSCSVKWGKDQERIRNISKRYNLYIEWCKKYGYEPLSTQEDCQSYKSTLYYVCKLHGKQSLQCTHIDINKKSRCCAKREHSILTVSEVEEIIENNGSKWLNKNSYIDCTTKNLNITCPLCNKDYITSLSLYKGSTGYCPDCGAKQSLPSRMKKLTKSKYERYSNICKEQGYVETLTQDDFYNIRADDKISFICPIHDYIEQSYNHFINGGSKCYKCAKEDMASLYRLSPTTVSNIISSKNNNILLNPEDYKSNSCKNLEVLCGTCKRPYLTSLVVYNKNVDGKCPDCSENSYGEYLLSLILDKYEIVYIRQMTFDECKDKKALPFDFYLPDYNLCIEYDGEGHYKPCFGEEPYLNTLLHDSMKNWYCKWNDIDILRIPYWERNNLEKILIEKLNLPQIVDIELSNGRIFKYKAHKPKE